MSNISQINLKKILKYKPKTGLFLNKIYRSGSKGVGSTCGGFNKSTGYIEININGFKYKAHRLAWLYTHGYFPENDLDHINRVKTDNRIINLREVSRQCNNRNKNIAKNNKTGVVGVSWFRKVSKWRAVIGINSKTITLGDFYDFNKAVLKRWEAEKKYNFPNCNTTSTAHQYLKKNNYLKVKALLPNLTKEIK